MADTPFMLTKAHLRDANIQNFISTELKTFEEQSTEGRIAGALELISKPGAVTLDGQKRIVLSNEKTHYANTQECCADVVKNKQQWCKHRIAAEVVNRVYAHFHSFGLEGIEDSESPPAPTDEDIERMLEDQEVETDEAWERLEYEPRHAPEPGKLDIAGVEASFGVSNAIEVIPPPHMPSWRDTSAPVLCSVKFSIDCTEYYYRFLGDTEEEIRPQVQALRQNIMKARARQGQHPKPNNKDGQPQPEPQKQHPRQAPETPKPEGALYWDGKKPTEESPTVVKCPLAWHNGAEMKRYGPNEYGYWYSHKDNNGLWCYGKQTQ